MAQLAPPLLQILQEELACGNEIVEETTWLPACIVLIILKRKFHKQYPLAAGIQFIKVEDPHYWYAEYNYESAEGKHSLACGFDPPYNG
ncbi:hypothetical protein KB206_12200 [Microvirga sp. STS02]|uniref:hypothetical protein n=1 Tax=Hymenobacter negativus TaxID=2795026 RepID=UPI0018DE3372|nr:MULTISPECIES: hypothetical protein [Bacteria]MBH8569651.1 hypothetical protein [Hymenobacter negativus]MBR7209387.1 hypothetical protein [Microvirga sp. STS02]